MSRPAGDAAGPADGAPDSSEPADTLAPAPVADEARPATPDGSAPDRFIWLPDQFDAIGPPLGAGATAVVWPVRHRLDGREFALKVWRRPLTGEADRARFRREVRRSVALNGVSGHIVTYSWADEGMSATAGTSGIPPWIGMERHGQSLHQVTEGGRPSLPVGLVYCADLLAGLAAMHRNGILHRDVKPGNLVTDSGRAKLCDLGLALASTTSTQDGAAGTPRYLAPELRDGLGAPSFRSDVYGAAQTIRDIVGADIPEPLAQLLTEAGSVNQDDRPADAGAFESSFRRVVGSIGMTLPEPLPAAGRREAAGSAGPIDPPDPLRGHRWRRIAVPIAALLVVGAVVLGLTRPWVGATQEDEGSAFASTASTVPPQWPDAGRASADIAADGRPIVLPTTESGRCEVVVEGAERVGDDPYVVDGIEVARLWIYVSTTRQQACAKLVKPSGSRYVGVRTHLALTLCGDGNSCDFDWNSYSIDAGPVVVPSRAGCISTRVSMLDDTGGRWLVRGDVQWSGCPG